MNSRLGPVSELTGSYPASQLRPPLVLPGLFILRLVTRPSGNCDFRMTQGLSPQIFSYGSQATRAHRVDGVAPRPSKTIARGRVSFFSRNRGATTLEALEQLTQSRGGMNPNEKMHVRADHPDLQDPRTFLRRYGS